MLPYSWTTNTVVRKMRRLWKMLQAFLAGIIFNSPSKKIKVIGITGTTGKTSTVHLSAAALRSTGYNVGLVSSIQVQVGTRVEKNLSGLTSLGPWQLRKYLAQMVRYGCHYAVLEVSSHALEQKRLWGIQFDAAVITNISRDHLDYHGTWENYASAKRKLFKAVGGRKEKRIKGKYVPRILIASLDDPNTKDFLREPADMRYGLTMLDPATPTPERTEPIYLYGVRAAPTYTGAVVMVNGRNALLRLRLPGLFNVRNALSAIAIGVSQGIPVARVTRELSEVRTIPGRFEHVKEGQSFKVIVDYAVTEEALKNFYQTVKTFRPRRIIAIFGACGDRDRGKRPAMAEVVGKYADVVFLTNEDPFSEDPWQIFTDLEKGLKTAGCQKRSIEEIRAKEEDEHVYTVILGRREAMREAVSLAQEGDAVTATGKGVEETMRFKNGEIPWSDTEVLREELRRIYGD